MPDYGRVDPAFTVLPSFAASWLVRAPMEQVPLGILSVVRCKSVHEPHELDHSFLWEQAPDRVCFLLFLFVFCGLWIYRWACTCTDSYFHVFFFFVVLFLSAFVFFWDANGLQKTCLFLNSSFGKTTLGKTGREFCEFHKRIK